MKNSNESDYHFAADNLSDMEKDFQIETSILSHR